MRESFTEARRYGRCHWILQLALTLAATASAYGCSDTGGSTAIDMPGQDSGSSSTGETDAEPMTDGTVADVATDTGHDVTVTDVVAHDVSVADSPSGVDATTDAGADSAALDAALDSGGLDAGTDTGGGGGTGRLPDGGCVPGSVACGCDSYLAASQASAEPNNQCSDTELLGFMKNPDGGCLDCLLNTGGCLDSMVQGTSNQECEDPYGGAGATTTASECLAALQCDFGIMPAASPAPGANGALSTYCGSETQATCAAATSATAAPGACVTEIVAGFPAGSTAGTISANISVSAFAAGRAGAIVGCARTAGCHCF